MNAKLFKPAWWLPNSHLQTIWPVVLRGDIKALKTERERFELPMVTSLILTGRERMRMGRCFYFAWI